MIMIKKIGVLVGLVCITSTTFGAGYPERNVNYVISGAGISLDSPAANLSLISFSQAKISGKVSGVSVKSEKVYERLEGYAMDTRQPVWTRCSETLGWRSEKTPEKIEITASHCGQTINVDLLSDGQFSSVINLDDGYFFRKNQEAKTRPGYSWWSSVGRISFRYKGFEGWWQNFEYFFLDADTSIAEKLLTQVNLEFVEKNSRVPLSPADVRVIVQDGPTIDTIKSKWIEQYDQNCVSKLSKAHDEFKDKNCRRNGQKLLPRGNVENVSGQSDFKFWTYAGSTIKIEIRDKGYYYFEGLINADKTPSTKQTILLIEIGGKVRADDEGHGGQIISE